MRRLFERKRLLMLVCFVAMLGLAACGDDNGGNNGAGNNGGNNGADAGDQDTGDQDTGDQDTGDDDAGDTSGDGCDVNGFTAPTDMVMEESPNAWSLFGESGDQLIELSILKDGGISGTGTVEFEDVSIEEMDNALFMADGCTDQGCAGFYLAIAGTLDVTTWETETDGGAFEATLTDLELAEIEQTQAGWARVDDGQTWCIDSVDLTATVDLMDRFPEDLTCDNQGFEAAEGTLSAAAVDGGPLFIEEATSDTAPADVLRLEIWPSLDGAATAPGTYEIDDFNYQTCANCVLIETGCDGDTCERTFIAGAGTLEVTSAGTTEGSFTVGEQYTATLTNAELVEVTIDSETFESSLVENGEGWCLDSYSWDVTIEAAE